LDEQSPLLLPFPGAGVYNPAMLTAPGTSGERVLRGIPVSPGICRGKILVLSSAQDHDIPRIELPASEIPSQLRRLEQALLDTRHDIQQIQREVSERLGAGEILAWTP